MRRRQATFATMENQEKMPPIFSPWLFWDSDPAKIDFRRDASYVVRRVFDLGRLDDIAEAMCYYPKSQLVKILTEADSLPENAVYLAAALFNLNPTDFKCFTSKRFQPLS